LSSRLLLIPLIVLALACAANAALTFELRLHHSKDARDIPAGLSVKVSDSDGAQLHWTSPDGQQMGKTKGIVQVLTASSLDELKQKASGAWTLTATRGSVASVYEFTPDLSELNENMMGEVRITSPAKGEVVETARPTVRWKQVKRFPGRTVEAPSLLLRSMESGSGARPVITPINLDLSGSWTATQDPLPGKWLVYIYGSWQLPTQFVKLKHISGPDLGFEGGFSPCSYLFSVNTTFTIDPKTAVDPTTAAASPPSEQASTTNRQALDNEFVAPPARRADWRSVATAIALSGAGIVAIALFIAWITVRLTGPAVKR